MSTARRLKSWPLCALVLAAAAVGCAKGNDATGAAGSGGRRERRGPRAAAARRTSVRAVRRQGAARPGEQDGRHDGRDGAPAGRQPRRAREYMCSPPTMGGTCSTDPPGRADHAMKTWNINTVRLPLNESCWLGLNGSLVRRRELPRRDHRLRVPPAPARHLRRAGPALVGAGQHGDHGRLERQPAGHDGVRRSRARLLDVGRDHVQERPDGDLRPVQRADPERQRPLRERADHADKPVGRAGETAAASPRGRSRACSRCWTPCAPPAPSRSSSRAASSGRTSSTAGCAQAGRPDRQPDGRLPRLPAAAVGLRHQLLGRHAGGGRAAGPGAGRRDGRAGLRARLHRPVHGVGRRARASLPRLGVEPAGLQHVPGADHRLRRHADGVRPGPARPPDPDSIRSARRARTSRRGPRLAAGLVSGVAID